MTRFFLCVASALAARAAGSAFATTSGADCTFGAAASTSGDIMSGAGAGAAASVCIESGCQGFAICGAMVRSGSPATDSGWGAESR